MLPPAPARLSITTGWPSPSESRVPTARAMVSLAPPGAKPSTKRIGRAGYSAAWTVEKTGSRKAIAAATTQPDLFDTGSPFQGHFTPRIARGRASLATGLQPDNLARIRLLLVTSLCYSACHVVAACSGPQQFKDLEETIHETGAAHPGRALSRRQAVKQGLEPGSQALHRALPVAADAELRLGGIRHQQRGQFTFGERAHRAPRRTARRRCRSVAHDARHRLLCSDRHGAADRARGEGRLCGRADAAP